MVIPGMLDKIPMLASTFAVADPQESPLFDLPEVREFGNNGLDLLKSLISFSDVESFQPPATYSEMFSLIRLADYVGADLFLEAAARCLGVHIDAIANHNSIRFVRGLVRGRYQASRHNRGRRPAICTYCSRPIDPSLPVNLAAVTKRSPCCDRVRLYVIALPLCKGTPQIRTQLSSC